jgi:hypothetical protein
MLRLALERAGIVVVSAYTHQIREGRINVDAFIAQHDPAGDSVRHRAALRRQLGAVQHLSQRVVMEGRNFVLTSTNVQHVTSLAGRDRRIYEIVGRCFDLDEIVQATREAVARARDFRT